MSEDCSSARIDELAASITIVDQSCRGREGLTAIYVLLDPDATEIRYVGKATDPWRRLGTHRRGSWNERSPCVKWNKALRESGRAPVMAVIEWVKDWEAAETKWIAKLRADGHRLLNVADGGDHMRGQQYTRKKIGPQPFKRVAIWWGGIAANARRHGRIEAAARIEAKMDEFRRWRREITKVMGEEGRELFDAELCERLNRARSF